MLLSSYDCRADKGMENVLVGEMIRQNGGNYMRARSVNNVKIERMWRDVRSFCTSHYLGLFEEMEANNILDTDIPIHLAALQYIYIPRINRSLTKFKNANNFRPCRSFKGKTPRQKFILGRMKYQANVPDELPPRVHADPVNFPSLTTDVEHEQVRQLKALLSQRIPNPLVNTGDYAVTLFEEAINVIEEFVENI